MSAENNVFLVYLLLADMSIYALFVKRKSEKEEEKNSFKGFGGWVSAPNYLFF